MRLPPREWAIRYDPLGVKGKQAVEAPGFAPLVVCLVNEENLMCLANQIRALCHQFPNVPGTTRNIVVENHTVRCPCRAGGHNEHAKFPWVQF